MEKTSKNTETITSLEDKAKIVEWILDRLVSGEDVPKENIEAFRSWFANSSNAEIKIEGLYQNIKKASLNTLIMSFFFNAENLTNNKREEITSWLADYVYTKNKQ